MKSSSKKICREPGQILNYDVNIVESRRQIGRGKAVIDAGAYYSILYMPKTGGASSKDPEESGEDDERIPVFCRGKIDFTQFVKFPDSVSSGDPDSRVTFEVISSQLDFEVPEEGGPRKLMLRATVAASVDVFRRMERGDCHRYVSSDKECGFFDDSPSGRRTVR